MRWEQQEVTLLLLPTAVVVENNECMNFSNDEMMVALFENTQIVYTKYHHLTSLA